MSAPLRVPESHVEAYAARGFQVVKAAAPKRAPKKSGENE